MNVHVLFPVIALLTACLPAVGLAQHVRHEPTADTARAHLGAMATGLLTTANPALLGRRYTEGYLTQPNLMGDAAWGPLRVTGTLNVEGYTLRRGELNAGMYGEGYADRRHPHTLVHEAMLAIGTPSRAGVRVTLAGGKGFTPYGTDDPMMRPFVKYPVNHHHAQIIERVLVMGAVQVARGEHEPFASHPDFFAHLQHMLLFEIVRRIIAKARPVTCAKHSVEAKLRNPANAADRMRSKRLDINIEFDRRANDLHFANNFAGNSSCRTQRQPDVKPRQIAREQQITFGSNNIEHWLRLDRFKVARDPTFGAAGVAAHLKPDYFCHQHVKANLAIFDPLWRYLNRREIAH